MAPTNLMALASRLCSNWWSWAPSATTVGSVVVSDGGAWLVSISSSSSSTTLSRTEVRSTAANSLPRVSTRAYPRTASTISCIRSAPRTTRSRIVPGLVVEFVADRGVEELEIARDHPQRLLEIVRDDVGELFEFGVGPGERLGTARELALGGVELVGLLDDALDLANPGRAVFDGPGRDPNPHQAAVGSPQLDIEVADGP